MELSGRFRGGAVARLQHGVPHLLEDLDHQHADRRFVVDDHHRVAALAGGGGDRERRLRRLVAAIEPLEARALLAAQPTAVADAYTVVQDQALSVSFARNYLVANLSGSADPYTWTTADGPLSIYNVGTSNVMVSAGVTPDPTSGWGVVLQSLSGLPLQPGTYVAAGGPAVTVLSAGTSSGGLASW